VIFVGSSEASRNPDGGTGGREINPNVA